LEIRSLSFVAVEATDLEAWRHFACDILGLMRNEALSSEKALYLRTDEHPFRLVVERSERDGLGALGWQVAIFHFMLEARSLDDVGYALDRVAAAGVEVTATLGKHANDHMTSFYVRSPSGFDVEFGMGGIEVDDATWTTGEITRTSFWGYKGLA
jgi:catechol 2,3-dioxygenase-like lactoylglutathione lyase family enzyme